MPGTNKLSARSLSAQDRNKHPCGHCKKNRQRCDGGYPCTFCVKFKRSGCARGENGTGHWASEGFIQYDPNKQRSNSQHLQSHHNTQSRTDVRNMSSNNAYGTSGGGSSSSQSQQTAPNNGSGSYAGYSNATSGSRSRGFGQMQLIGHNGQPEGYIESFIHTHNGVAYYGARYYDQSGALAKEDTFLSRVGENDSMQMLPPLPTPSPFSGQTNPYGYGQNPAGDYGTSSSGQPRKK